MVRVRNLLPQFKPQFMWVLMLRVAVKCIGERLVNNLTICLILDLTLSIPITEKIGMINANLKAPCEGSGGI